MEMHHFLCQERYLKTGNRGGDVNKSSLGKEICHESAMAFVKPLSLSILQN